MTTEATIQDGLRNRGYVITQDVIFFSSPEIYYKRINDAKRRLDRERIGSAKEITQQIPDCPELFALALSPFPNLKRMFITTHLDLAEKLNEEPSFDHRTYTIRGQEIDPDENNGFTGFYLKDVLEAIYFLFGVVSSNRYKARIGIIKLLGALKKPEQRTQEEKRLLESIKPPQALQLIKIFVNIMQIDENDLQLLNNYVMATGAEEKRQATQQIREKYPEQTVINLSIG